MSKLLISAAALITRVSCADQNLTNRFWSHTEPTLGMRCSRPQLQRQKSILRHLP
jgi:hypothetical protein